MQNLEIDIKAYGDFLLENEKHIWCPINLDCIDPKDGERAARVSWENYNTLLSRGIERTMPVFHEREHMSWLDRLLEVTNYVGISSGNSTGEGAYRAHEDWYRLTWNHITDSAGRPIAGFHGFGDTAPKSLNTFPWATVDSSTWYISGARAGTIILDGRRYQARSKVIRGRHFLDIDAPEEQKQKLTEKFAKWGINWEKFMKADLTGDELAIFRCYCTAAYILELLEDSKGCTTYKSAPSLIMPRSEKQGYERIGPAEAFFVISGSTAKRAMPILTKLGINNALLSYHYTTKRVWEEDIIPWLYDPVEACQKNEKMKKYWDLLEKFSA